MRVLLTGFCLRAKILNSLFQDQKVLLNNQHQLCNQSFRLFLFDLTANSPNEPNEFSGNSYGSLFSSIPSRRNQMIFLMQTMLSFPSKKTVQPFSMLNR